MNKHFCFFFVIAIAFFCNFLQAMDLFKPKPNTSVFAAERHGSEVCSICWEPLSFWPDSVSLCSNHHVFHTECVCNQYFSDMKTRLNKVEIGDLDWVKLDCPLDRELCYLTYPIATLHLLNKVNKIRDKKKQQFIVKAFKEHHDILLEKNHLIRDLQNPLSTQKTERQYNNEKKKPIVFPSLTPRQLIFSIGSFIGLGVLFLIIQKLRPSVS